MSQMYILKAPVHIVKLKMLNVEQTGTGIECRTDPRFDPHPGRSLLRP